ncbi:hypothetical protein HGRIS_011069 [Hohenbuehelia grisea]|uniref:Magnesium-dependent phosphatase-1 n=1 Tax=Hohenbuehelia grisea TaxID=104357 RepID=A0ABR3IZ61_9AGAR
MAHRFPKLIAFDLDYTLWDLWIDTHVTPPFKRNEGDLNRIVDSHDREIAFYEDVASILHRLRATDVTIAACSRTHAPKLARQALTMILVPPPVGHPDASPTPAIEYFDQAELYPGSKLTHFKQLHEKTGIPYSEMLFFDDERRNREVKKLGVTFCLVPDGLDNVNFEAGLEEWRSAHPEPVHGEE